MHNRKFFLNAAVAFGLLAAGSSFAAETSTAGAAANASGQHEAAPADIKTKTEKMTPEQRKAFRAEMKAKWDKMTPEQRAEMKSERMKHRAEHMEHRAEHMEHSAEHMNK